MLATRFARLREPVRYASSPQTQRDFIGAALRGYDVPQFMQQPEYTGLQLSPLQNQTYADLEGGHDPAALMAFLDLMHEGGHEGNFGLPGHPLTYSSGFPQKGNHLMGVLQHILRASQSGGDLHALLRPGAGFGKLLRDPSHELADQMRGTAHGQPGTSSLSRLQEWLNGAGFNTHGFGQQHPQFGGALSDLLGNSPHGAVQMYDAAQQSTLPQAFRPREESSNLLHRLLSPTIHQFGQGG